MRVVKYRRVRRVREGSKPWGWYNIIQPNIITGSLSSGDALQTPDRAASVRSRPGKHLNYELYLYII